MSLGHPEDSLQGRHSFPASEAFVEGQPFSRFSFSPLAWSEPHGDTRDGKQAGRRPQTRQGCADSEGQTRASAHPANIDTAGPGRGVEEGATAVLPTGDRRFPLGFNPILQQPKLQQSFPLKKKNCNLERSSCDISFQTSQGLLLQSQSQSHSRRNRPRRPPPPRLAHSASGASLIKQAACRVVASDPI